MIQQQLTKQEISKADQVAAIGFIEQCLENSQAMDRINQLDRLTGVEYCSIYLSAQGFSRENTRHKCQ